MILTRPLKKVFFARRCVGKFFWFHCSASRASLVQVRAFLVGCLSLVRSKFARPTGGILRNEVCTLRA
jgi:hypothetical protein